MTLIFLLLIVVAAVIALPLVSVARRPRTGSGSSVAEIVSYLILVVATVLATTSFSSLVESILPGDGVLFNDPGDVALTLSNLIVSGAVWASVWIAFERRRGNATSPGRGLYLAVSIAIALSVVVVAVIRLLAFTLDLAEYQSSAVAQLLTFGALWWLLERWRGQGGDELDEIRLVWGSLVGLGLAIAGASFVLYGSLSTLFESEVVLLGENPLYVDLKWGAVLLVVGLPLFIFFWLRRMARRSGILRDVYAGAVAVIAWFTAATAFIALVYLGAVLLLNLADFDTGDAAPGLLTSLLVGLAAYWHHRPLLGKERTEPVRAVEYLFGASSLLGFAGSLIFLAGLVFSTLGSTTLIDDEGRSFIAAIVSLVVTGALTVRYWGKVLTLDEPRSPSRRAALLFLFFSSAVTAGIALITVLFVLLRAALASDTSDLGEPLAWGIPTMLVSGALTWHAAKLRRDRAPSASPVTAATAPAVAPAKASGNRTVTLVASDPGPLPQMIEKMRFLRRVDGIGVVDQARADEIVAALSRLDSPAAMVTVDGSGFQVLPIA
ncbi:MAG TPA: hypothetical protein VJ796_10070 [Acidimicrobiia bacterium]|nr:hypothetical protein [Acidimicrobiia bacterium]